MKKYLSISIYALALPCPVKHFLASDLDMTWPCFSNVLSSDPASSVQK